MTSVIRFVLQCVWTYASKFLHGEGVPAILRAVLERLKSTARKLKQEFRVYRLLLKHRRTPRLAKILLGLAVGYALLPMDIIPDFIPVIGYVDDIIIVPALVVMALRIIPKDIVEECRAKAYAE